MKMTASMSIPQEGPEEGVKIRVAILVDIMNQQFHSWILTQQKWMCVSDNRHGEEAHRSSVTHSCGFAYSGILHDKEE